MNPVLKPFPKASPPSESVHTVRFLYEQDVAAFKQGKSKGGAELPRKPFEDIELTEREPTKSVSIPLGYARTETVIFFKPGIAPFLLHEAIRKGVSFDRDVTRSLAIDTSRVDAKDAEGLFAAMVAYVVLGAHEPTRFGKKASKGGKKPKPAAPVEILFGSPLSPARAKELFEIAVSESRAANLVRTLAELPTNELRPATYLERIRPLAREWGVKLEFFDQKALEKRGANAFLAVVRANPDEPYGIAKLSYKPKGKGSGRRIALVGKGLCFDTGGYNIKVGEGMLDMHRDMTGSAVALATFGHLVETESADEIDCYLALAENLISPTAYKPNDVVVASNGVSIEVVDTDAEGRMVLSDTLVMACEREPDLLIDYATLTGAVIRAIDTRRAGVFSNRSELLRVAMECGDAVGERVWPFPIGEDYWEAIQSEIADVRQCATTNNSDHIYAATFLSSFVKPEVPWLHVDLACESHKGGLGLSTRDITGYGIRLTGEILRAWRGERGAKKAGKK
jgi:leucyl aminopeptidase